MIRKRTSHITVELDEMIKKEDPGKGASSEAKKVKEGKPRHDKSDAAGAHHGAAKAKTAHKTRGEGHKTKKQHKAGE
jgi:hypothetical protein